MKQAYDRTQAEALTQVTQQSLIPEHAKKVIGAFLAQGDELGDQDVTAPEANAYEFQSQGVIDMLEKLHDKFEDERTDLEKEESNARHAFEMLAQDLTAQIETATEDREAKAREKASKLQQAAEEKGDLADTTATRDADQVYLDDLVATCSQKSSDFESRQQLRTEELEAIAKAVEILSSGDVSGNADKYLPSFVQVKKAVSFMQVSAKAASPTQARVAEFPFVKVKKMIKDLIVRLMEEVTAFFTCTNF